jgi:hypothetical protein
MMINTKESANIEASKEIKNIKPGDVKFKDQNGDGVINENDRAIETLVQEA